MIFLLLQYMRVHLEFLQFLLKEGDIYLAWARCKDIWDTLVDNPKASDHDKEVSTSLDSEVSTDLSHVTEAPARLLSRCFKSA